MQESPLPIPPGPTSSPKPANSSHGRGGHFLAPLGPAAAEGAGDCADDVGDGGRRCGTESELGLKGKLESNRRGGQKDANWKKKCCVQSWL